MVRSSKLAQAPPGAIQQELQKILASNLFSRTCRLSRFLRFTVERFLSGNGAGCKEYELGLEVFDKPATFDPRIDPIVRVLANRLRSRLRKYYETEGRNDPILIDFPCGKYEPVICSRMPGDHPGQEVADGLVPIHGINIAVLPFADLSPGYDQGYLADGLTEELICALTKLPDLHVVSQTSTFQYKGRALDIRQIGHDLRADAALEGSLRKMDAMVRITAQLVDIKTGLILWSESYERLLENLLVVQKDISKSIAQAIADLFGTA